MRPRKKLNEAYRLLALTNNRGCHPEVDQRIYMVGFFRFILEQMNNSEQESAFFT